MLDDSLPKRVLVADDNRAAALTLAWTLELFGYEVHTCFDGDDALEKAFRCQPAVMLLDIGMPGIDGFELCRRLRAEPQFKQSKIIAQTGWGRDEFADRSRAAGFDMFIEKPVPADVLRRAIEGTVENSRDLECYLAHPPT